MILHAASLIRLQITTNNTLVRLNEPSILTVIEAQVPRRFEIVLPKPTRINIIITTRELLDAFTIDLTIQHLHTLDEVVVSRPEISSQVSKQCNQFALSEGRYVITLTQRKYSALRASLSVSDQGCEINKNAD
jgi:hypothetical protein